MAEQGDSSMAASNEVIIERVEALRCDVQELCKQLQSHNERETQFREHYIREYGLVDNKAQQAHERLDMAEGRMAEMKKQTETLQGMVDSLQKSIQPLIFSNKILVWLGTGLGASLLVLVWSLITGQAQLVFP